jgi:hypothetical protein
MDNGYSTAWHTHTTKIMVRDVESWNQMDGIVYFFYSLHGLSFVQEAVLLVTQNFPEPAHCVSNAMRQSKEGSHRECLCI